MTPLNIDSDGPFYFDNSYVTQMINYTYNLDAIIVNFNSTDYVINCIESLKNCIPDDCNLKIYVFDNASQDDPRRLTTLFPDTYIYLNGENIGFGAAINRILKTSNSEFLMLINPDALVTKTTFQNAVKFVRFNPDVGIAGPKILNEDGSVQGSARAFPTPLTSLFGRNSPLTKMCPNNSISKANILTCHCDGKTPMEVDWVSGACMIVRRKAMLAVGGFDERFFLYWEDTDLCRRIKDAGWKVIYFPEAIVTHSVGKSSNTRPVFANYQFHKSCYRLYDKYTKWPFSVLIPLASIVLMLRFITAVLFNKFSILLNKIKKIQKNNSRKKELKKSKIRIFRVISRMNIGGASIHVNNLTKHLNTNRFITRLIIGTVSPMEGDMDYITNHNDKVRIVIPELQREISPYHDMIALLKVIKEIRRFNPHIIHSHTSKAGTISRVAALLCNLFRKRKIITVHTFHGNVLDGYFSRLKSFAFLLIEKLLAKFTDRIIAISKSQKEELVEQYKITRPEKVVIINLGFDFSPFQNTWRLKGTFRQKVGVDLDTLFIGIVGRLVPIKNHYLFLDAARLFLAQRKNQSTKFIVIGNGELRSDLEAYSLKIGISNHVIFHGWEKDIPMVYADLDILALTSTNEGTPVSIIEAMASSVPVITTGVGGINDLLGDPESTGFEQNQFKVCERGILCPKNDPIAFAAGLSFIIQSDFNKESSRIINARDFVLRNYTTQKLVRRTETLYETLTNQS